MRNIKIVFEHDKGFVERVIRWLTSSDVNHCAVLYDSDDWDSVWVAEAAVKGVRAVPGGYRKWKYVYEVKYDATKDVQIAQQFIGQSYDFAGFFLFGWFLLLWKLLKIKFRHPLHKTKGQFCSEFLGFIIAQELPEEIPDTQWTTPQELVEICKKHPERYGDITPTCSSKP